MRKRVLDRLDDAFLDAIAGNFLGGFQMLAQGQPFEVVHTGFLGNMTNIMRMRQTAAAYFAEETKAEDLRPG